MDAVDVKKRQNFISVDKKTARNSYGDYFQIGDIVKHDDDTVGTTTIQSFVIDEQSIEIKAITEKGWAHIDFIYHIEVE